jgi:hypothetical protein
LLQKPKDSEDMKEAEIHESEDRLDHPDLKAENKDEGEDDDSDHLDEGFPEITPDELL